MEEKLKQLLMSHQLTCGMVIDSSGKQLASYGDFARLTKKGLATSLVGTPEEAKTTFCSLEAQILPQMWSQGCDFAFVDKPTSDLMVVVFGSGDDDAIKRYRLSKEVSRAIRAMLKSDSSMVED